MITTIATKTTKIAHSIYLLVGLAVLLGVAGYFVATQPVSPQLAIVSSISVVLFAAPSYWVVLHLQGWRRGLTLLVVLGLFALVVESSALATGFPYGNFTYTDVLGGKLFGLTPWTVAFAYPPILLLAYFVARQMLKEAAQTRRRWLGFFLVSGLTALLATACDLVLDPAAVHLGFWYWDNPGGYYEVPLGNFAGWLLSSFIGGGIVHVIWGFIWGSRRPPSAIGYSGLAIVWFWTMANFWLGQWLPALIGILLSLYFIRLFWGLHTTMKQ